MRFGIFEVDRQTGELRKAGVKIKLQDQPFQVLEALLETPGQLVTREQLRDKLWPQDTFVDFDHALTTAIKKLRRALNDSATQPRYIETLPKRGYRFIAPVENNGDLAAPDPKTAIADSAPPVAPAKAHAGRVGRLERQRLILATALAIAGLALAVAWIVPDSEPSGVLPRRFSIDPGELVRRSGKRAVVAPNGRHIAYVSGVDRSLWIRDLESETPRRIEGSEGASQPFWSPDSAALAFRAGAALKRVSVHGGPAVTICELPGSSSAGGAWSPDGKLIVFSSGLPPTLYEAPAAGGEPTPFIEPEIIESGGANIYPEFITAGGRARGLVFTAGSPADQEMFVVDLKSKQRRSLGPGALPVFDPAGYLIYQSTPNEGGLWALPFSGDKLEPTGKAFPIEPRGADPSVTDDGTLVFVDAPSQSGRNQLVWRDRAGRKIGPIGLPQDRIRRPTLSPDGRLVAVEGVEDGNNDIWIHDVVHGTKTRFTFDPAMETDPVWTPAGDALTYRFDRSGNAEIFQRPLDRSRDAEALLATPLAESPDGWSPDGRLVYAVNRPGSRSDLWMLGASSEEQTLLLSTPFNEIAAQVSPDGRFLAYCSDESGRYEVYVSRFPVIGRPRQISRDGGCQPRWSRNGRELFYVEETTLVAVEVLPAAEFAAGPPARLFQDPQLADGGPFRHTYDVSGDGGRFVLYEVLEESLPEPAPKVRIVQHWRAAGSARPEP